MSCLDTFITVHSLYFVATLGGVGWNTVPADLRLLLAADVLSGVLYGYTLELIRVSVQCGSDYRSQLLMRP